MTRRTRRLTGGETPADKLSLGNSLAVRPGRSAGINIAKGATLSERSGRSPGQAVSKGASLAVRRMSTGGYMGPGDPAGIKRTEYDRERNRKLAVPHYAKGGHAHKKIYGLYKILHSHFAGDSEPGIEKKSGGKLWVKDATKNKGAFHRSLGISEGKKIPLDKIHKAERSKNPKIRKQAQFAETSRGFHHKHQGR